MSGVRLIHADVLTWLRDYRHIVTRGYMPKYHAVLCDPPYGLDFMGQSWDDYDPLGYQRWVTEWATLLLDFVYPNAVLMAFGGTRTYHRLACGLEDAGWELFDCLSAHGTNPYLHWVYGSGFPKNTDISKQIDKRAGAEREVVGEYDSRGKYDPAKSGDLQGSSGLFDNKYGQTTITAPATPEAAQWSGYGTAFKPSFEPIVCARAPRGNRTYAECALRFGTGGLHIDGSRVGTAADMKASDFDDRRRTSPKFSNVYNTSAQAQYLLNRVGIVPNGRWPANTLLVHDPRCTDRECAPGCVVRELGDQSGESVSSGGGGQNKSGISTVSNPIYGNYNKRDTPRNVGLGDTGTAARFFYQAKSPGWEREAGLEGPLAPNGTYEGRRDGSLGTITLRRNPHPTCKPIQLATYLAGLLKPPIENARLLVPFAGVASEMIGAHLAGWRDVTGIERDNEDGEYLPVGRARLRWWSQFDSYAQAQARYQSEARGRAIAQAAQEAGQMSLFDLLEDAS